LAPRTVLAPLAAVYVDDHALAIDVADLERGHLCAADAGRIECHEHGALKGVRAALIAVALQYSMRIAS